MPGVGAYDFAIIEPIAQFGTVSWGGLADLLGLVLLEPAPSGPRGFSRAAPNCP
jgi:hypothetical protein